VRFLVIDGVIRSDVRVAVGALERDCELVRECEGFNDKVLEDVNEIERVTDGCEPLAVCVGDTRCVG
jgi:hypothetical protein